MKSRVKQQDFTAVNRAFSRQSVSYDRDDSLNPVLTDMRRQVYVHIATFLKPSANILELNAGTGIDAAHFASEGHNVLATDLSDGMINEIQSKIRDNSYKGSLSAQQVSFDKLQALAGQKFDYAFSNFGGLNCIADLSDVTRGLDSLLHSGSYVSWVIMPPVYFWEWMGLAKGRFRSAFRRMRRGGVIARLEGEHFMTYYHSLADIRKAFGNSYELIRCEGLCVISPPPHRGDFPKKHRTLYSWIRKFDALLKNIPPFNITGDHIIVTLRKR